MNLSDIIAALQAQLAALQAFQASQPQFTQADLDAAKAAGVTQGVAQGLSQAASVLGADLAKLTSDVASLTPPAPPAAG